MTVKGLLRTELGRTKAETGDWTPVWKVGASTGSSPPTPAPASAPSLSRCWPPFSARQRTPGGKELQASTSHLGALGHRHPPPQAVQAPHHGDGAVHIRTGPVAPRYGAPNHHPIADGGQVPALPITVAHSEHGAWFGARSHFIRSWTGGWVGLRVGGREGRGPGATVHTLPGAHRGLARQSGVGPAGRLRHFSALGEGTQGPGA